MFIAIIGPNERVPPKTRPPKEGSECVGKKREGYGFVVSVGRGDTKGLSLVFSFSLLSGKCLCVSRRQVGMRSVMRLLCQ